jgi:FkbM family methyltransferase
MKTFDSVLSRIPNRARRMLQSMRNGGQLSDGHATVLLGEKSLEEEIRVLYRSLLERDPDVHELLHWKTFIGIGNSLGDAANSLVASLEYQQKISSAEKVLIACQNFKIYLMQTDLDVGITLIKSNIYEPHTTRAIANTLKVGDVFLDLGANIGYFSLLAASIVHETGKVIAFEPNVQNLQLLYSSILENRFENVTVYPFAASNSNQILRLTSFGSNGYLEAALSGGSNFQLVQSVILDELLKHEKRLDVVKMDIEGYETLALRGMDEIIKKHKPILFTEFSPWHIRHRCKVNPKDYLNQITQYGYTLSITYPGEGITIASDVDYVMNFWESFDNDKQHLDLIARPV